MTDRLLIVDDQRQYADFLGKVGHAAGFEVAVTETVSEFLKHLELFQPSVMIIDLVMPEMDGIALLRDLAARKCTASILLTSGLDVRTLSWAETTARELGLRVVGLIPKPVRANELRSTLAGVKQMGAAAPSGKA